jgi:hypothetical protein
MSERRPKTEAEAIELVRSIDAKAPEPLRRRVEELIAEREHSSRSSRLRPRVHSRRAGGDLARWRVGAGAIAALAVALVLALALVPGGSSSGPGVNQAAALALSGATHAAPAESRNNHSQLAANVDGIAFPYWERGLGWRSTGSRIDRVGGRSIATVFYSDRGGHRVGYAIVAGLPAPRVSGGTIVRREGVPYRVSREHDASVVSWLRHGRLCVVAGHGVDSATLLSLASWRPRSSIPS